MENGRMDGSCIVHSRELHWLLELALCSAEHSCEDDAARFFCGPVHGANLDSPRLRR